ncbi:MAG: alpha-hydroxy-acid oxidizing protein [Labedaea sp.]
MNDPVSLADFESRAESRLARDVWDFIAGGSGSESTLAANRSALDAVSLLPRVLAGTGTAETSCQLLKSEASLPVAIAPMAYQRLVHPDGELAMAAAARDAGIPFVAPTLSSVAIEEIARVGASTWFQLYWLRERPHVDRLVGRAEEAGCQVLMVTVDVPMLGRRLRDMRNEFRLPADVLAANLTGGSASVAHAPVRGGSAVAAHTEELFAPALGWADLDWLRERTSLPLVVKGILDPRDAVRAVEAGADAVVVSNHGGRQLDGAAPSVAALPGVVAAVGARCEVLLDSGIRSGTDVLRALALGASGVLAGRPLLWGLAVDGAHGAGQVLGLLLAELRDGLTLAGCANPAAARTLAIL